MRISIPWLKKFVEINEPLNELAEMFSMLGLEAELPTFNKFSGIVVGHVKKVEKHPNADRLSLCVVSDGTEEYQVVCGAPNVAVGQNVPFAKVGALLGEDSKINRAKIRGEKSFGMICSERELGISDNHDGIMVLPKKVELGVDFHEYLENNLTYLDIDLTPNRPDCLSHTGAAREISVKTGREFRPPKYKVREFDSNEVEKEISIEIEDENDNPRYVAGIVKNIRIAPSPKWVVDALKSVGQRSINNIVDISNYVLLEMGHPTHMFDYEKIPSKKVLIRRAKKGETITTLDEEKRILKNQLLITDGMRPIAIAGIMGGLNTAVTETTTTVLIESAYFEPITIRRGAKSLGMATDASKRFERGADPEGAINAFWRVVELLEELAGGEWVPGVVDAYAKKIESPFIKLTRRKIDIIAGCDLTDSFIESTLQGLGVQIQSSGHNFWICIPPSYRPDLEREIDLIEECCRVFGYNNIPSSFHYGGLYDLGEIDPEASLSKIVYAMVGVGFRQCFINSLTDEKTAGLFDKNSIPMKNPLSKPMSYLRTSLFPGLLQTADYNIRNGNSNIRLFEIGKEYISGNNYKEYYRLSGVVHGESERKNVHAEQAIQSIFTLKGSLESCLKQLNINDISFSSSENPMFGYGLSIKIKNTVIGHCGKLNLKKFHFEGLDIQNIFGFDIELKYLIESMKEIVKYTPIIPFPKVERDLNFVLDNNTETKNVTDLMVKTGNQNLIHVQPIDIFQHESLGENKKSVTFHLQFQSKHKTLEETEINSVIIDITRTVKKNFNAELRG